LFLGKISDTKKGRIKKRGVKGTWRSQRSTQQQENILFSWRGTFTGLCGGGSRGEKCKVQEMENKKTDGAGQMSGAILTYHSNLSRLNIEKTRGQKGRGERPEGKFERNYLPELYVLWKIQKRRWGGGVFIMGVQQRKNAPHAKGGCQRQQRLACRWWGNQSLLEKVSFDHPLDYRERRGKRLHNPKLGGRDPTKNSKRVTKEDKITTTKRGRKIRKRERARHRAGERLNRSHFLFC